MDGFKNIEIKNFRGIDHLEIDDFSRVNVFLGQNNSGKSTVLEAITMLMSMSNPDVPQQISAVRARKPFSNFIDIKYFFRNMDVSAPPEVSSKHVFDELADPKNEPVQQTGSVFYVNTLEMNFDITNGTATQSYKSWLRVNPQGLVVNKKSAEGYMEKNRAWLIPSDLMTNNLANDLTELIRRNKKDTILALLKLFDERINGIEILTIVASAANPLVDMILIDEIDNGLHYSVYRKLWQALFTLAVASDKQLFVTTHSKETLCHLSKMLEENTDYQKEMRLYTIENTKLKGHQAYKLTYDGLHEACTNDIELRSIV